MQSLSHAYFNQNFHHAAALPHALQNLLASKRRKSENYENVPSINSPLNHSPHRDDLNHNNNQFKSESSVKHNLINEMDESSIKRETVASDQAESELDLTENYLHNNNDSEVKRELLGSSKKTMNDVLKLLTNKMRGSSLKDGRKGSTEQDFESKM